MVVRYSTATDSPGTRYLHTDTICFFEECVVFLYLQATVAEKDFFNCFERRMFDVYIAAIGFAHIVV